jgi:hypothetical protein
MIMFSYDQKCTACLFRANHSQAEHEANIFDWYSFHRPDDELPQELRERISKQLKARAEQAQQSQQNL